MYVNPLKMLKSNGGKDIIVFETKKLNLLIIIGLILFMFAMISGSNATKVVYVNGSSGNDHNSGTSWKYAKATVKSATNAVDNKGTVYLADGNYKGLGNTKITVDRNMSIIGQSRDGTIIDGTKTNWFFNVKSGSDLILKYLTLQNGYAGNKSVILNNGTLSLNYCKLTRNSAVWDGGDFNEVNGGAIYNNRTLILNNTIFTKNSAENGGAIYNNRGTVTFNGYC